MKFKLDHINLTVNDIEKSLEWYRRLFGLEKLEEGVGIQNQRWAIIGRNDSMIAMTEYKYRESPDKIDSEKYYQVNHFGFRIPDREDWEKKIKKYNLELYYGGINEYPNSVSWYVKDPSGHTIEVSYTDSESLKFSA